MEKVHKSLSPKKRQRKTSQSAALIEPMKKKNKIEIKNKSDTVMKKKLVPETPSDASKASADIVQVEIQPLMSQTPKKKKKKAKKPKDGTKSGLVNTSLITDSVEEKKAIKRELDASQVDTVTPASPLKKKKRKQLLAELNELKEQVIGPIKVDLAEEKPVDKPKKVKVKKAEIKLEPKNEDKYPVLNDKDLVDKFMAIPMANNQKGRIREAIKLQLQGSDKTLLPDIIHGKMQAILNSSPDLTGSQLRRIRVLYNMLKTSLSKPVELSELKPKKKVKKERRKKESKKNDGKGEGKKEKKKGPKRYVVFLGNLPLDINKDMIMEHFRELNEHIVDVRLPQTKEGIKSAIGFLELSNEPSYELALSKHHSMLANRRINVLYNTQKNSKITKEEAKGKTAKLIALQKAGKLVGSIPTKKKRSHRRAIMRQAKKAEEAKLAVLA